ncbi:hypothetical protein C1645_808316 [Glomus cerebriforme]|uniref:Uncharacterized protein n=1 Tax=Glomus cerebriforme TaxID=658196 RepID=A0A397SR70_9GLOM|nr:hypothetical protein C1645_808316 [Glomus cerebriforme]
MQICGLYYIIKKKVIPIPLQNVVIEVNDLTVICRMTSVIQNVESSSHKISTTTHIDKNPKILKITLTEQITYLEKDFILMIKGKDLDQPRAFVEYNPETQTNCVMLTLVPKFVLNTTISER